MAESLWTLPFGKFKGIDVEGVPNSYLKWLLDQEWMEEKYSEAIPKIEKELDYRERFDIVIKE